MGGNLYDAVFLAVKAALHSTRIPVVSLTSVDGGQPELELSDDPFNAERLNLSQAPVLVTLTRIGNHCVVDATPEEESCSSASLLVATTPTGTLATVKKIGGGSFQPTTLSNAIRLAISVGKELNAKLMEKLQQEEAMGRKREKIGFL
jgi:exosome complex component RRP42